MVWNHFDSGIMNNRWLSTLAHPWLWTLQCDVSPELSKLVIYEVDPSKISDQSLKPVLQCLSIVGYYPRVEIFPVVLSAEDFMGVAGGRLREVAGRRRSRSYLNFCAFDKMEHADGQADYVP